MCNALDVLPCSTKIGTAKHATRCGGGGACTTKVLPLHAKLSRFVRRDFDDQCFDKNLGTPGIQFVDDRAQVVIDGVGRGNDD